MLRGRVLVGLLVACALASCDRRERPPTAPNARVPADEAAATMAAPTAQVCTRACQRLQACAPELTRVYQAERAALGARFPFACLDECGSLEGSAAGELARTDDCVALDSCIAFYTCASGDPPPATLTPVAARLVHPTCSSLCARVRACGDEADPGGADAEAACVLGCEASAKAQSPLACASRRTCGGLLGCVRAWRESGYASERDAAPPGVTPLCDQLCARAIRCGAEHELTEAELTADVLAELRDTMASTYMECALACGDSLGPHDRTRFETCLGRAECKAFEECADAL